MRRIGIFILLALGMSFGIASAQDATNPVSARRIIDVADTERIYSVYAPDDLPESPRLIIALHGRGSSGKAFEAQTHLNAAADANGWLVVYPQAFAASWNDGGGALGLPRADESPADDLAFIDALISELEAEFAPVDVSLAAFDTGGSLAQHLLCASTHDFSAALLVGSVGWSYYAGQCADKPLETDMLLVYGAQDQIYTPTGADLTDTPASDGSIVRRFGFEETILFWAGLSGCGETPEQAAATTLFVDCNNGASVAGLLLPDLAHNWPRTGDYTAVGTVDETHDGANLLVRLLNGSLPVPEVPASDTVNRARTYTAYVPTTYTGEEALPLLVGLHGRPGTGADIARMTEMSRVAEENGFIAVYPDGINREWAYLNGVFQNAEPLNIVDDVAFLNALPADLARDLNIDPARIYLYGFSNGGFMTYRTACDERTHIYAAFGIGAALMYPEMELPCLAAPVRPMIIEHGTEDVGVAWDGISHRPIPSISATSRNVLQSVSFFAARNGCAANGAQRDEFPGRTPETAVIRFDFADCTTGMPVRFFAIIGGGHTWPGVAGLDPNIMGDTNMDIHLSEEMWEFFAAHPLE